MIYGLGKQKTANGARKATSIEDLPVGTAISFGNGALRYIKLDNAPPNSNLFFPVPLWDLKDGCRDFCTTDALVSKYSIPYKIILKALL